MLAPIEEQNPKDIGARARSGPQARAEAGVAEMRGGQAIASILSSRTMVAPCACSGPTTSGTWNGAPMRDIPIIRGYGATGLPCAREIRPRRPPECSLPSRTGVASHGRGSPIQGFQGSPAAASRFLLNARHDQTRHDQKGLSMPSLRFTLALALLPLPLAAQETSRVAVISAFEPEWIALQEDLADSAETLINGNRFITGTLGDKEVVLFLSGISMVNAAMTTQLALDHFDISHIVFSGIAGGVDPGLHIGDVVVPEQWGQYLEGVFARETAEGTFALPSWMSSEFPNYGMMYTRPVEVVRSGSNEPETRFWLPVDPALLETARGLADTVALEDCNEENSCLSEPPEILVGGNGVSGMAFVDNAAFREFVFDTFEARVLDMESAAVAHVAYANDVPFIAFRSLSDLAGGGEGENQMATFMSLASSNSAEVVKAFLGALPPE